MDTDSPSSMDEFNIDSGGAAAAEMSTASLSEVLASRSKFLEEIELWALCRECCLTLEYVHECADLFQTLCISPDTVAFDPEGNVCFLDLDMEPDPMFIAPENESSKGNSYKSHLFSLGMTLLFATEYNTKSNDPRSQLGDEFTDLLASLTNENMALRPDLDTVILACDRALGDQQSQEICFRIIGYQSQDSSQVLEPLQLSPNTTDVRGSENSVTVTTKDYIDKVKDINENCLQKPIDSACQTTQSAASDSSSFDEEESSQGFLRKLKGLTLTDVIGGLDRFLNEKELWAICDQSLVALQKKRKHLPAYISPDTILLRGTGSVSFKPISDDKPLEMIYMAPELQQKGVLNDKTCLYGLGKSLQTAGGCKYSSTLNLKDGEAVELLVQAFIHTSPDYRTTLETALEMCEEYNKVKQTSFIDVCQKLYQEASRKLNPLTLSSHQSDVNQPVSLDTMSLLGEDSLNKTIDVSPSISLFKPVSGGGAFKPILPKPIPRNVQQNMPTAFISPATHFKPIVVEETHLNSRDTHLLDEKSKGLEKESNVVTKLKEIKESLSKHHTTEAHLSGSNPVHGRTVADSSQQSSQPTTAQMASTNLPQDHQPNADLLVSAIAQYLKSQLMKTPDQQVNEQKSISHTTQASDSGSNSKHVAHTASLPAGSNSVSEQNYFTWQLPSNMQQTLNSNAASLAPGITVPFQLPEHSDLFAQRSIPEIGSINAHNLNKSPHLLTTNVPYSASNPSVAACGYPMPYSNITTANFNAPYPFYHDSNTGVMMPYPYPHSGQGQNFVPNFPANMGDSYASSGHHFNQGQMHASANYFHHMKYSRNATQTFPSTPQSGRHQVRDNDVWNQSSDFPHQQMRHRPHEFHHPNGHSDREASISHSSTPSPSKDSGIFLSHLPSSHNKDNLLEKLLKSQKSHKQDIISHVLSIIRDHFAEDGMMESGFDDITIAEYIVSLSSLTWETFCSAITEKYFHLLWSPSVLQYLYDTISGPTSQESYFSTSSLTRKHTQYEKKRAPQSKQVASSPSTQYQSSHYQHHQIQSDPTGQLNSHPAFRSTGERTKHQGKKYEPNKKQFQPKDARENEDTYGPRASSLHNTSNDHIIVSTATDEHQVLDNVNNQSFKSSSPVSNIVGFDKIDKRKTGEFSANPQAHMPGYPLKSHTSDRPTAEPVDIAHPKENQGKLRVPISNGLDHLPTHSMNHKHSAQSTHNSQLNSLNNYEHKNIEALRSADNNVQELSGSNRLNTPNSNHGSSHSSQLSTESKRMSSNSGSTNTQNHHKKHGFESSAINNSNQKFSQNNSAQYNGHSLPRPHHKPIQRLRAPSAPNFVTTKTPYYIDSNEEENLETEFNTSAEMRKLAANKPELFKERWTSKMLEKRADEQHNGTPKTLPNENSTRPKDETRDVTVKNVSSNGTPSEVKYGDLSINPSIQFPLPMSQQTSGTKQRSRPHSPDQNKSSSSYGRSLSAVYTNKQPKTGVQVVEDDPPGPSKRGSGGSPDLAGCLLPYTKKGQVVYHSAMIQLSLTPEVNIFINSIDEENKLAIENRLSSIGQEILVLKRQRKKTQRFYTRLNKGAKVSKGDQHVSEQTMKELTEVTKKLSFLHLCRTHLEMLLAELNGLETCYLYSISASEGNGTLSLQSCIDNPYLQFRTLSSPGEGQISILQTGTPRGLMAYLYKSSALSDGFIHQFLLCFRYILTSDQFLTFILDKCHSAQGTKTKDVNLTRVERRSLDLVQFWLEGYYSIDFAPNKRLMSRLAEFLKEQMELKVEGADNLFSMYAACRMGDHSELMLMTEMDEDDEKDNSYFLHLTNSPESKTEWLIEWDGFKSLLKHSKSEKLNSGLGSKTKSEMKISSLKGGLKEKHQFSVFDCPIDKLAEQLTLMEQGFFRKCHPVHFLNSQFQGIGVALSMPGLRTPSMSRKTDPGPKKGLFVGEPIILSGLIDMISHSQELAHWVSAEVLSCGSNKHQVNLISKFLSVAIMCLNIRNFATALSILDGLENLVVKQLPAWKNISSKYLGYMNELANTKMKLKSETMWLMSEKNSHVYPTIPCALYAALQIQQLEIGSFTLANGMFKWDKIRSITEAVDQMRIFRDHEYGFQPDVDIQEALHRYLKEYSEQDLHAVASTQDNNFRRHSSSSSLSGTLKKVKEKLQSKKK